MTEPTPATPHVPSALGIDVGSTATKCVGIDKNGAIVWRHLEPTAPRGEEQIRRLLGTYPATVPLVATGYGRKLVPRALDRPVQAVTEITCHARGARMAILAAGDRGATTLVDIGGQDSKAILLGEKGNVVHFAMNDKCAAGTGRFLENTARRLEVPVEDLGHLALAAPEEHPISSTCTVFAESEVVSLLAQGATVEAIVRGLHRSLVRRVAALAKSAGLRSPRVYLSGGVAQNQAVAAFLAEELDREVRVVADPAFIGAFGAALIALAT